MQTQEVGLLIAVLVAVIGGSWVVIDNKKKRGKDEKQDDIQIKRIKKCDMLQFFIINFCFCGAGLKQKYCRIDSKNPHFIV